MASAWGAGVLTCDTADRAPPEAARCPPKTLRASRTPPLVCELPGPAGSEESCTARPKKDSKPLASHCFSSDQVQPNLNDSQTAAPAYIPVAFEAQLENLSGQFSHCLSQSKQSTV